jgi:hypothetical protein
MSKRSKAGEANGQTVPPVAPIRPATHGGFDNDAKTMNTILSKICGKRLEEGNGGFTVAELNPR